jgi:hypothetical protein
VIGVVASWPVQAAVPLCTAVSRWSDDPLRGVIGALVVLPVFGCAERFFGAARWLLAVAGPWRVTVCTPVGTACTGGRGRIGGRI